MSRAKTNKLYRTFTKGLITEAGYLTYPENSSTDELNTVISRKGNRTRRLGINYEDSKVLSNLNVTNTKTVNEFVWKAIGKDPTINFFCVQIGSVVSFYGLEADPISDSLKGFTVDLMSHVVPGRSQNDVETGLVQFGAGAGYLFLAHPFTEPLLVEYTLATDSIAVTPILVQIRDLIGVYDSLANDEEPATLTKEHLYNLLNQGWGPPGSVPPIVTGTPADTAPVDANTPGSVVYYDPYAGEPKYRRGDGYGTINSV